MKRKFVKSLIALSLCFCTAVSCLAADITLKIDGSEVESDVPPVITDGRTMVPLRVIAEALGADVEWNSEAKTVTVSKDGTTVVMTVGSTTEYINGLASAMDAAPQIIDGRTLLPVRYISEALGCSVFWDSDTATINIISGEASNINSNITVPEETTAEITTEPPTETTTEDPAEVNERMAEGVLKIVNEERAAAGVSPLSLDSDLTSAAFLKAQDMAENDYFDHTSPTYGSPFDMLSSLGISFSAAGENIAYGQTSPESVMNSWMNSDGHRANILSSNYRKIGIGYVYNNGETRWVQIFTD